MAAVFWNVGLFAALMHLPGAFDHLPAIGVGIGAAYWSAGAALGRAMKSASPRTAALWTLWTGCSGVLPYLTLLVLTGPQTSPGSDLGRLGQAAAAYLPPLGPLGWPNIAAAAQLAGAALGGIAALGGLLLGARSAAAPRRARSEPPAPSLPSGGGPLPA